MRSSYFGFASEASETKLFLNSDFFKIKELGCGNTDIPIEELQITEIPLTFLPKIPIPTASVDTVFPLIFLLNPEIPLQKRPNTVIP